MATAVSTNDERHASSLIVALKFYPQMAIKMIHEFPPNTVLRMIECVPNDKFRKSLNDSEKYVISTLNTDGFKNMDISLLYKLIRSFNLLPEPSKKWGNRPLATDINQGDDMERMRFNRNDLVHRPRGGLSEVERDKFFKESIEIACRVDLIGGIETEIRNVKIHHITQEEYRQALEKCAELQQQLKDMPGINRVDLYYGDDIAVKLGHQDLPATDSTRCTIYVRDPNMNVPTVIEQLEQANKRLNEGDYNIILLAATSGSLVLHVEIHNLCFITKDSLHKAIAEFLRRVFTSISGSLDQHIMEVVLAECDSYIISDNEEKNDEYLNDQESSVLKLDVMVRNTSLQSETDLYRDVDGFISKVLDVTDKDVESTNGSPLAVTMTSQHVDDSSPSGTPEKKKLVGYKIDPDQLKLIKEDEGNTILCNEAKEFTKEGVQGMAFVGRQKVSSVVPPNHFGPIPGIEVGTLWKFRKQVSEAGVHRPHIAGIHGREDDGAYSVVLSGIYEDDKDDGDEFTYTGSGGRDLKGSCHKKTAQSCDQTLTRMNKALTRNVNVPINANDGACAEDWKEGKPVRVVRNYKGRKHSKYAPEEGNRYDGIYKIVKYWPENGKSGFLVWRYLFRRDDPNPAPWSKAGKKKIEELGLTMQYPEGYLEAQAKKDEEAGEVSKKGKRKRDDNDSSPSGTPEKKKKFVGYKIDPDQLKVINEFTKEGVQVRDGSVIEEEEQREVMTETIEFLKIKLEEEGLHFRGSIPNDGNSFFKACSDQLQHLGISGHTHTELRQIVSQTLSFCSENEIKSANFTRDTWKTYINKVAKDKENVEDIVVETMAKVLQRQIIVCSKSYLNGISRKIINEDANGTPLLLAKDKLYYQSLERQHDGTQSRLQESNTPKVRTATIEFLKKKLEEEGLHFHGSIPDDGNSFFKACSDQLQCLEIPGHTHTELRQMVIQNLQFYTENEIKSANFTRDTWKIYIDKVAEDNENVEDIVVEAMAKLLRRQIIIYSRLLNSTTEISTTIINEDANETPLLLAKDKLYYQSLERRHGTPSRLQESNTSKREEKERIDMERKINEERIYKEMIENAAVKQKDRDIEIEERERMRVGISSSGGGDKSMGFGISTSRPLPGTSHEKNPEETYVSKVESEEGLNEKKKTRFKKITKDEKMLILGSYISLTIKSDWDKLVDNVYKSRNDALPVEMSKHYEDLYKQNKLKNRIKSYIQRVLSNRINETDTDIKGLIKDM